MEIWRHLVIGVTVSGATAAAALATGAGRSGREPTDRPNQSVERASGTLYVLDSARRGRRSQVLGVQPATGRVVRTFAAGYMPDMALSPDGTRLYVTSSIWDQKHHVWESSLTTYDTMSGRLVATAPNPDDLMYTLERYPSKMTISPSGRWIYILKNHQTVTSDNYYVAVFDTSRNQFLSYRAALFGCRQGLFFPTKDELAIHAVCIDPPHTLSEIAIDATSSEGVVTPVSISGASQPAADTVGAVASNPDTGWLTLVTGDWQGVIVSLATRHVRRLALQGQPSRWVPMQRGLIADGGNALYFATSRLGARGAKPDSFDQIVKADPNRLTSHSAIDTRIPFYSMCLSTDGTTIYTVSPDRSVVTLFDAEKLTETGSVGGIGASPILAVTGP